jgi:hypothetical protein
VVAVVQYSSLFRLTYNKVFFELHFDFPHNGQRAFDRVHGQTLLEYYLDIH